MTQRGVHKDSSVVIMGKRRYIFGGAGRKEKKAREV